MPIVSECASLPGLGALRSDWQELIDRANNVSASATWQWVAAFWKRSAADKQWLLVRDDHGRKGVSYFGTRYSLNRAKTAWRPVC